jgi:hypothetical protein
MTIIIIFLPTIGEISFAEPIAMSHPGNKSFRQEMFDVCFAMFDVTVSSQQNWK